MTLKNLNLVHHVNQQIIYSKMEVIIKDEQIGVDEQTWKTITRTVDLEMKTDLENKRKA